MDRMDSLLIISTRYPHEHDDISSSFVLEQVEEIRKYFNRVCVISTTPYTPRYLSAFMKPRRRRDSLARDYTYKNVEVHFTRNLVFPKKMLSASRYKKELSSIDRILQSASFSPTLIHAHFMWPSGHLGVGLKKKLGVPLFLTIHEDLDFFKRELDDQATVSMLKQVDQIIRVNRSDLDTLRKYNKNTMFIPNGFNRSIFKMIDKLKARRKLGLPNDRFITFSLGGLIKRKGFDHLINAVDQVKEMHGDIYSIIGGYGPEEKNLERQINSLKLSDHVKLLGPVPEKELSLWLNACDLFVHPSLSESFGIVQIEAMACGKPIVATKNGGSEEIVTDDRLGYIVAKQDPEALGKAIIKAKDNKWDAERILKHSRKYRWDQIAQTIASQYRASIGDEED